MITQEKKGEYNDPHDQHPRVFFPEWNNFTRSQDWMAAKCIFNNLQEWGNKEEADIISESTCRAKEIGLIFICYGPVPMLTLVYKRLLPPISTLMVLQQSF